MNTTPGYEPAEKNFEVREIIKRNLAGETNNTLGICEQLRFLYDSVYQLPDDELKQLIIDQLIDAFAMAKKMGSRLSYYGEKYTDSTGHLGKNLIQLTKTRERKHMRRERPL